MDYPARYVNRADGEVGVIAQRARDLASLFLRIRTGAMNDRQESTEASSDKEVAGLHDRSGPGVARVHTTSDSGVWTVFTWLAVKYRATRRWGHRWLVARPAIHDVLYFTGALRTGAEPVARGIAVGLFVGLTPTVGVQTVLMFTACVVLRANFLAAFAISFISNPVTLPALYWVFYGLGAAILAVAGSPVTDEVSTTLNGFGDEVLSAVVGSILIAAPAAMTGYFMTYWLLNLRSRARRRKKIAA